MSIKMQIENVTVVCDTAEEAASMIRALGIQTSQSSTQKELTSTNGSKNSAFGFADFWRLISPEGRAFLRAISSQKEAMDAGALAERLSTDVNQVGWIRRKMKTIADEHNFRLGRYFAVDKAMVGEKLRTVYRASGLLQEEMSRIQE